MQIIRTLGDATLVIEFAANELGIFGASLTEAPLIVGRDDYPSRLGLPYDRAQLFLEAIKPTIFRFDPRFIDQDGSPGSREVDAVVPAGVSPHGPRITASRRELTFLWRAARIVAERLSAGPVGAQEYRARVGAELSEAWAAIRGLRQLLETDVKRGYGDGTL